MTPVSTIRKEHRDVELALLRVLCQLDELSPDEHKDFFKLLHLRAGSRDRKSENAIYDAMLQVLTQTPTVTVPLEPPEPIFGKVKLFAERVGRELLRLRQDAGLTQAELAELSSIPQSHINRLENAEHSPTRMTLKRLAAALKVDLQQLDPTAVESPEDDFD